MFRGHSIPWRVTHHKRIIRYLVSADHSLEFLPAVTPRFASWATPVPACCKDAASHFTDVNAFSINLPPWTLHGPQTSPLPTPRTCHCISVLGRVGGKSFYRVMRFGAPVKRCDAIPQRQFDKTLFKRISASRHPGVRDSFQTS